MPIGTPHLPLHRERVADTFKHLTGWFESGELKTTATEYVPGGLTAIPKAQERLMAGVGARKLIVHPSETS
ncbi:hypothetical protein EIP91_008774 [Steccherinum ochraceum]|uniref:Alcohol dehydrogenase-like C-terminal domain-containing protein n=1 Tax=Steccherinum ochraceum TaxID=92696 RepID=A0A4R0R538_9APHY|nr:hypothetical protein EIP91_008774 [Steccherinum ochraceum]